QNVSANVTGNSVVVTWQAPAGADETLLGYNVYRDNQKISNTITSLTYTDTNVPTGSHWYSVCAVYTEGESELAQPVQVNVGSLQGKLQGFIRNAVTNAVIQNAWVSALDSDFGAVTYNTIFGSHYTLYLSAGTYSVSCTAPGFQTLTVNNVVILEGQTKALNFYLHSSSESNLGGEVTGVSYFEFEDFSVYPNPASSEINITTTSAMKHVKIMNNMGQVVFVDGGGDLLIRVNTTGFSRGIYFIEVETENHRFFEKLIIN
ncbi:MAG TPA: T9SS type A sorting domain-containing protein, partial [Bacteroidales bacterium]|nr:T9SS type A sorting domain-containing protein [Bacteroidales bacterium]